MWKWKKTLPDVHISVEWIKKYKSSRISRKSCLWNEEITPSIHQSVARSILNQTSAMKQEQTELIQSLFNIINWSFWLFLSGLPELHHGASPETSPLSQPLSRSQSDIVSAQSIEGNEQWAVCSSRNSLGGVIKWIHFMFLNPTVYKTSMADRQRALCQRHQAIDSAAIKVISAIQCPTPCVPQRWGKLPRCSAYVEQAAQLLFVQPGDDTTQRKTLLLLSST